MQTRAGWYRADWFEFDRVIALPVRGLTPSGKLGPKDETIRD